MANLALLWAVHGHQGDRMCSLQSSAAQQRNWYPGYQLAEAGQGGPEADAGDRCPPQLCSMRPSFLIQRVRARCSRCCCCICAWQHGSMYMHWFAVPPHPPPPHFCCPPACPARVCIPPVSILHSSFARIAGSTCSARIAGGSCLLSWLAAHATPCLYHSLPRPSSLLACSTSRLQMKSNNQVW